MASAIGSLIRLARAGWVLAREGVVTAMAPPDPPAIGRLALWAAGLVERREAGGVSRGLRASRALNRLGPSYVKLGQFLATRPDVVGRAMADDLEALQDRVEPFSSDVARAIVAKSLGKPLDEVFLAFGDAVAAASIAQVHKARVRTRSGEEKDVAVKVLRPDVEIRFRRDLDAFYLAAKLIEAFVPFTRRLRPIAVVDTLARSVRLEMDLRLEAAALSEMAENTAGDPDFRVPSVDWERTQRTVLTLEWIDGIKLNEPERLAASGHDPIRLARVVMQSFLRHAMRDGFFHADMHQGNLFVDAKGDLVAVDFGITGRLNPAERRFLAEILYGFITRDYMRTARVHFEAGYVPASHELEVFAQALRAVGEPLRDRPPREISMAGLLGQLFEYTDVFDMKTQPRLILLQKTMVVVEGVGRVLDPDLDIWAVSEPVVREWVAANLGPGARLADVGESAGAAGRLALALPRLADRLETVTDAAARWAEAGVRLDAETVERLARETHRRGLVERIAWVVAAASLATIAYVMMTS
ncbi:MAG: 2-polyprenylphenol 6-hydroxylase [Hyphomicrobiales bacterium]|nr:2-polyprenylphenol 6-hydroxylase [Hyphomicrobiales bacterium]